MRFIQSAFSGYSVNELGAAKTFYCDVLGLELTTEDMGLGFNLPGGGTLFMYLKKDHQPATFTVLNLVVANIDEAVKHMAINGVTFEKYNLGNGAEQDEIGVLRGLAAGMGPDIAWFKDPSGNVLSVMQNT